MNACVTESPPGDESGPTQNIAQPTDIRRLCGSNSRGAYLSNKNIRYMGDSHGTENIAKTITNATMKFP